MALWRFTTPTVTENYDSSTGHQTNATTGRWDWRWVSYFIRFAYGVTVWQDANSVWHSGRFPTQDDINFAKWAYIGGAISIVNDTNKAAIIAANIGVDSSNFTPALYGDTLTPAPHGDDNRPMPPTYNATS